MKNPKSIDIAETLVGEADALPGDLVFDSDGELLEDKSEDDAED